MGLSLRQWRLVKEITQEEMAKKLKEQGREREKRRRLGRERKREGTRVEVTGHQS